jgi:hypothetical protein
VYGGLRGTLEERVVCIGQGPGLVQLRHHLKGALEGEGEQQWPKGVPLTYPTLEEDHRLSPFQQQAAMPIICPRHHGQQCGATLLDGSKHPIPAQGVEGVLPVNLYCHAAGVGRYACAEGVASNLAPS